MSFTSASGYFENVDTNDATVSSLFHNITVALTGTLGWTLFDEQNLSSNNNTSYRVFRTNGENDDLDLYIMMTKSSADVGENICFVPWLHWDASTHTGSYSGYYNYHTNSRYSYWFGTQFITGSSNYSLDGTDQFYIAGDLNYFNLLTYSTQLNEWRDNLYVGSYDAEYSDTWYLGNSISAIPGSSATDYTINVMNSNGTSADISSLSSYTGNNKYFHFAGTNNQGSCTIKSINTAASTMVIGIHYAMNSNAIDAWDNVNLSGGRISIDAIKNIIHKNHSYTSSNNFVTTISTASSPSAYNTSYGVNPLQITYGYGNVGGFILYDGYSIKNPGTSKYITTNMNFSVQLKYGSSHDNIYSNISLGKLYYNLYLPTSRNQTPGRDDFVNRTFEDGNSFVYLANCESFGSYDDWIQLTRIT